MEIVPLGIFLAVAGAALVGVALHRKHEKQRTEQLSQLAGELGFEFKAEDAALSSSGIARLPLFNRGHENSRKFFNVLHKIVRGTEIYIFDYRYVTGGGKNRATHRHVVAAFQSPTRRPAEFEMRPENVLHRIGALFGYQDINFDSHPTFSRRYLVRGNNELAVREAFSDAVLNYFETLTVTYNVESRGGWVAVYALGKLRPDHVKQFLATTTKVYLLFAPESGVGQRSDEADDSRE